MKEITVKPKAHIPRKIIIAAGILDDLARIIHRWGEDDPYLPEYLMDFLFELPDSYPEKL